MPFIIHNLTFIITNYSYLPEEGVKEEGRIVKITAYILQNFTNKLYIEY